LVFRGIQVKKERRVFISVFERAFVEWEDRTLSLDVNIQIFQTDPHGTIFLFLEQIAPS